MTAIDNPPMDPDETPAVNLPVRRAPLPSRDQVTAIQVGTLLHSAMMLSNLLPRPGDPDATTPQISEAAIAAENSIVKICARLDGIVEDADRWTLSNQHKLEDALSAVYAGHLEVLAAQKVAIAAVNAPHKSAGVRLVRLETGAWAAVLGDFSGGSDELIGVGGCPAAALADFDRKFLGQTNEDIKSTATLDASGPKPTSNPPRKRRFLDPNRRRPGSDSKSSSTTA